MYDIQQGSAASPLVFLLVLTSDHISPATGKTPTVTLSKNGAAFASPAGAVTEIGNGWYQVAGHATDSNTVGPLILHATAAASDPSDREYGVVDADAVLKRDMSLVSGEAARSPINALRFLRNKWSVAAATLTVTKEDDTTTAWTAVTTGTAGADPITAVDPA